MASCSHQLLRIAAAAAILATLAGCAQRPLKDAVAALDAAPICCKTLADLPYAPLKPGDDRSVAIGPESPAYRFDEGVSHFSAHEISGAPSPVLFTVSSYFSSDVLFPIVSVLDVSFQVVRTVGPPQIRYVPPGWIERGRIEGAIELFPAKGERYVVVHTASELIGRSMVSQTPRTLQFAGSIPVMTGGSYVHRYSTMGSLRVQLSKLEGR